MDARSEVLALIGDWIDGKVPVRFGDGRGFRAWLAQTRPELVLILDALGREPARDEPSFMTPHLLDIRRQAKELEVSPEAQKGILFLTGLTLSYVIEGDGESPQDKFEAGQRLSHRFIDRPPSVGWRFDYRGAAELLEEMARNLDPSYLPPRGSSPTPGPLRLPKFGPEILSHLPASSAIHRRLVETLGRMIGEGLEGAFIAGCRFVTLHSQGDMRVTFPLAWGAYHLAPPHVRWLRHSLQMPADRLGQSDYVGSNLITFVGLNSPDQRLKIEFSNHMIDAVPSLGAEFWDGRPADYIILVVKATWDFLAHPGMRRDLAAARDRLFARGLSPPAAPRPPSLGRAPDGRRPPRLWLGPPHRHPRPTARRVPRPAERPSGDHPESRTSRLTMGEVGQRLRRNALMSARPFALRT